MVLVRADNGHQLFEGGKKKMKLQSLKQIVGCIRCCSAPMIRGLFFLNDNIILYGKLVEFKALARCLLFLLLLFFILNYVDS